MKVLLINGSPHANGCTYTGLKHVAGVLKERGIDTEIIHIGAKPVGGCVACEKCSETGRCVFDDIVNIVLKKIEKADAIVFGAPVYFASPNGSMIAFMDRLFNAGNFNHKPACVIASARRGGCSASLDVLNKYPTYHRMPLVSGDYWPIIHGNTPAEVEQDLEGIYTLEVMAKDLAWIMKCIEAGKEEGILPEVDNKTVWTNFIR